MRENDHVTAGYSGGSLEFGDVTTVGVNTADVPTARVSAVPNPNAPSEPQVSSSRLGTYQPTRATHSDEVRVRAVRATIEDLAERTKRQKEAPAKPPHAAQAKPKPKPQPLAPALTSAPGEGMAARLAENLTANETTTTPIPANMVGRIDEVAYAAAAARAERVFEGRAQKPATDDSKEDGKPEQSAEDRMTARLADAVQAQREEEAKIAKAKVQRAALVAERNGMPQASMSTNGVGVMARMPNLDPQNVAAPKAGSMVAPKALSTTGRAVANALKVKSTNTLKSAGKALNVMRNTVQSTAANVTDMGSKGLAVAADAASTMGGKSMAVASNVAANVGGRGMAVATGAGGVGLAAASGFGGKGLSAISNAGSIGLNAMSNAGAAGLTAAAKAGGAAASAASGTFRSVRSGGPAGAQGGSGASSGGSGGATPPPEDKETRKFGPWLTAFGAIASLLFVGVVSVWTYKLGQRDKLDVPVIAAMEGPARVRPEDAGGTEVAYQGLAVNEVIDGGGVEEIADVVVTAPRLRVLRNEDKPASELQAMIVEPEPTTPATPVIQEAPDVANATTKDAPIEPKFIQVPATDEATASTTTDQGNQTTLAAPRNIDTAPQLQQDVAGIAVPDGTPNGTDVNDALDAGVTPVAPLDAPQDSAIASVPQITDQPDQPLDSAVSIPAAIPADAPQSPLEVASLDDAGRQLEPMSLMRPRARPFDDVSAAMASAVDEALESVIAEAASARTVAEVREETNAGVSTSIPLPAGTRMIQLGAFDTAETAETEWARFARQHEDLLGSKDRYIQKIERSGRTFYRLRVAGYQSRAETTAACAALSARGLPCITATVR